jgi:putative glutamine amidotransferase
MLFVEKPKIGICINQSRADFKPEAPGENASAIAELVRGSGGEPIYMPYSDNEKDGHTDAAGLEGLILAGGDALPTQDLDSDEFMPADMTATPLLKRRYEGRLLAMVRARRMPVLGICYGMQFMNLFLNGTLLAVSDVEENLGHHPDKGSDSHEIEIKEASLLYRIIEQALGECNPILNVSATSSDKVIEAIEPYEGAYMIGVQWHPESEPQSPVTEKLFGKLIWWSQRTW